MIFSLAILRHPEVFLWHPYGILHGFSAIRSFSCANSLRIVAILCPRVPPFIILKGGKARKTMPSRLLHERSCHLEFCNFTGRGFSRTLLRTAFLEWIARDDDGDGDDDDDFLGCVGLAWYEMV